MIDNESKNMYYEYIRLIFFLYFYIKEQWESKTLGFVYGKRVCLLLFGNAVSDLILLTMRDWHHFLCPTPGPWPVTKSV